MTEKLPNHYESITRQTIDSITGPQISHETVTEIIKNLQNTYDQPDRYYHNFKHIVNVINFINENLEHFDNPRIALWAALYHDIVYDTRSGYGQNEDKSAKLAVHELTGKLPNEEVDQISRYINATVSHSADLKNNDLCLFLDADISILGSSSEIYNEYSANVRKEYGWVNDEQYADGRAKVLLDFLNRDRIFITDITNNLFEERARVNIENELNKLG